MRLASFHTFVFSTFLGTLLGAARSHDHDEHVQQATSKDKIETDPATDTRSLDPATRAADKQADDRTRDVACDTGTREHYPCQPEY